MVQNSIKLESTSAKISFCKQINFALLHRKPIHMMNRFFALGDTILLNNEWKKYGLGKKFPLWLNMLVHPRS